MRRFLMNLFGNPRTTKPQTRPVRRAGRTGPRVEAMEDRTVMSTAGLDLGNLSINVSPNSAVELFELNPTGNRQIEVFGVGSTAPQFPINAIQRVDITVNGQDTVYVNDSDGMPFNPGTSISLHGTGTSSSLVLQGSRTVAGDDQYLSQDNNGNGQINLDRLSFGFTSAISSVTDLIPVTGIYDVQTSGHDVQLTSSTTPILGTNFRTQTLTGLAATGGGTLNFDAKPTLKLSEYAFAADVSLDAPRTAAGEQFELLQMNGGFDDAIVAAAPAGILTEVNAVGSNRTETLEGNSGRVLLAGDSTTDVLIGRPVVGGESTHGINANVAVVGVHALAVEDNGDTSTPETVRVTESSVFGTGLFGNNAARLTYSGVKFLTLMTGQDSAVYEVVASQAGAEFHTQINILDFSTVDLKVDAAVSDGSNLNLQLYNSNPNRPAELFVHVPTNANVSGGGNGTGNLTVTFPDGSASQNLLPELRGGRGDRVSGGCRIRIADGAHCFGKAPRTFFRSPEHAHRVPLPPRNQCRCVWHARFVPATAPVRIILFGNYVHCRSDELFLGPESPDAPNYSRPAVTHSAGSGPRPSSPASSGCWPSFTPWFTTRGTGTPRKRGCWGWASASSSVPSRGAWSRASCSAIRRGSTRSRSSPPRTARRPGLRREPVRERPDPSW